MPPERQNERGRSQEPPSVVAYLIDTLRGLFQEEFETADRLSGKARQAFALAVGFFALVQTVAFNNFAKASENGSDTKWILIVALIAIVPVAIAAGVTIWADSLVPGRRFPLRIVEYLLEASYEDRRPTSWDDDEITPNDTKQTSWPISWAAWFFHLDIWHHLGIPAPPKPRSYSVPEGLTDAYSVPRELARYYIGLLDVRRQVNDERRRRYAWVRLVVGISIFATAAELIVSLAVRLP
jgi:hypothetical protein